MEWGPNLHQPLMGQTLIDGWIIRNGSIQVGPSIAKDRSIVKAALDLRITLIGVLLG